MLGKYAHLILNPIHPNALNHYRRSVYPSGAKSDPSDAALILDFLYTHTDRLRPLQPDTVETRTLQLLVEARREAVDDKTRYLNRLTAQLKISFPQVLTWFSTADSVVASRLLQQWPTLHALQRASARQAAAFLRKNHLSEARTTTLQKLIKDAVPAVTDKAVLEPSVLVVRRLVRQMEVLREAIAEHDRPSPTWLGPIPITVSLFLCQEPAPPWSPLLIAAFGTQRDRFRIGRRGAVLRGHCTGDRE